MLIQRRGEVRGEREALRRRGQHLRVDRPLGGAKRAGRGGQLLLRALGLVVCDPRLRVLNRSHSVRRQRFAWWVGGGDRRRVRFFVLYLQGRGRLGSGRLCIGGFSDVLFLGFRNVGCIVAVGHLHVLILIVVLLIVISDFFASFSLRGSAFERARHSALVAGDLRRRPLLHEIDYSLRNARIHPDINMLIPYIAPHFRDTGRQLGEGGLLSEGVYQDAYADELNGGAFDRGLQYFAQLLVLYDFREQAERVLHRFLGRRFHGFVDAEPLFQLRHAHQCLEVCERVHAADGVGNAAEVASAAHIPREMLRSQPAVVLRVLVLKVAYEICTRCLDHLQLLCKEIK